jgi:hypothetical protein
MSDRSLLTQNRSLLTQDRSLLTQGERKAHVLFLLHKETRGKENKRKKGGKIWHVIATELASISFSFILKPKA